MLQYGVCPRCKSEINSSRRADRVVSCDCCGWSDQTNEFRAERKLTDRSILTMLVVAALIVGSYFHSIHWGKDSLRIIPLKVKQIANIATPQDLNQIADICSQKLNYECVDEALTSLIRKTPSDLDALAKLARIKEHRKQHKEALKIYAHYFLADGTHSHVAHNYAKLLAHFGDIASAKKFFEYSLNSRTDIFQITVSKDYVAFLIKNQFHREALKFIEQTRKKGENASLFMEKELQELKQILAVAAR